MRIFFAVAVVFLGQAIELGAQSNSTTVTWTNGGITGQALCAPVATENGQAIPPQSGYYCPFQSTSYTYPDGYASLYIEGLSLEGITVKQGKLTAVANPDGTPSTTHFMRTDVLVGNDEGSEVASWVGTTAQNYTLFTYKSCSKYKCVTKTTYALTGGSGTLTAQ